jgi:hypothetical protein
VAGGFIENVAINGNVNIDSILSPISIDGNAAAVKSIVVSNNTFKITTALPLVYIANVPTGLVIVSDNTLECTIAVAGIVAMAAVVYAKVTGNFCLCAGGAVARGILMGAGCNKYTIQDNTVDVGVVGGSFAIQTLGSGSTSGVVTYNFHSTGVNSLALTDIDVGNSFIS